jgi:hypothetical protein
MYEYVTKRVMGSGGPLLPRLDWPAIFVAIVVLRKAVSYVSYTTEDDKARRQLANSFVWGDYIPGLRHNGCYIDAVCDVSFVKRYTEMLHQFTERCCDIPGGYAQTALPNENVML